MRTPYARRIVLAVAVSVFAHAVCLALLAAAPGRPPLDAAVPAPTRLRLEPPPPLPEPETGRRLVEVSAPDAPPERPTDLIAEVDARARDMGTEDDQTGAPAVDVVDEFERLAAIPPTAPLSPPEPIVPPAPEPEAPAPEPDPSPVEEPEPLETAEPIIPEQQEPEPVPRPALAPRPEPAPTERPEPHREERPSPSEVAQAPPVEQPAPTDPTRRREPAPDPSERSPGPARGRVQGAVANQGILAFEAMRDDIAPYLRHVQQKVERQWRLMMEFEYPGTARARAVVDCAIQPNGELAFVRIVDDGGNPSFAAASAAAMRRAAPFDPFPFEVPAMYREEHIVIRWTFNFL